MSDKMLKLSADEVANIVCGDGEVEVLQDNIFDQGRWETHHELIFRKGDELWGFTYSRGSTEYQEREYEDTECYPVELVMRPTYVAKGNR